MRYTPLIIFSLIALALLVGLLMPEESRHVQVKNTWVGKPFPSLALQTLQGKPYSKKTFDGKITLINVFASWCAPCEVELPELQAMKGMDARVQIIGIGWHDSKENVTKWVAEKHAPFDAVWLDAKGTTAVTLGLRGVPESFVVDAHGIVRAHIPAPITENMRANLLSPFLKEMDDE